MWRKHPSSPQRRIAFPMPADRPSRAGICRRLAVLLVALCAAGLALLADAHRPARAQNDFFFFLRPPADVGRPARPPRPNQNSGWWPFQPPEAHQPSPPPARRQPPPEPEGVVYNSADAATQGKRQPPSQFVLVIGDRLASQLAQGLADSYVPERARLAIVENTVDESGYLPAPVDWIARAPEAIAAARPAVTVVALGSDDLQPIKDGETIAQPLTERWLELYSRRVDEVLAFLREKTGRVIVVGLAPVANTSLSEDYARLNEVLRARAARAGFPFANVWDGFVDEDGKYLANGPAVDGQRRRLRFNDGVRFTRAGARKLAFFVQKDINRMLEEPGKVQAAPDAAAGDRAISLAGPPASPKAPEAVPVSASARSAARALRDGVAPDPVRGRADDFTWPPPGAVPPAAPESPAR
ncbi:GDSL-type esterase/lipase family protein [Xanthobacter sp. AM11]|uniref:SGNH/GDSL hydrolase family protein n=1 Tax=Xanthobacter sp. AM11 TaxID=3380643 RepID=UPI0039BFB508